MKIVFVSSIFHSISMVQHWVLDTYNEHTWHICVAYNGTIVYLYNRPTQWLFCNCALLYDIFPLPCKCSGSCREFVWRWLCSRIFLSVCWRNTWHSANVFFHYVCCTLDAGNFSYYNSIGYIVHFVSVYIASSKASRKSVCFGMFFCYKIVLDVVKDCICISEVQQKFLIDIILWLGLNKKLTRTCGMRFVTQRQRLAILNICTDLLLPRLHLPWIQRLRQTMRRYFLEITFQMHRLRLKTIFLISRTHNLLRRQ